MDVPYFDEIVKRIIKLVCGEAQNLRNVDGEVERLQNDLRQMHDSLDQLDVRHSRDTSAKEWVRNIRGLAYEAEDLLESFNLEMERYQQRSGFIGAVVSYALLPKYLWSRHKFGRRIKFLWVKVNHISQRRQNFGVANPRDVEEELRHLDEQVAKKREDGFGGSDLVGMEDERRSIMKMLFRESVEQRFVISIIGMGGLGKSTLAWNIYHDPQISREFNRTAWIHVGQRYKDELLLKNLILQLSDSSEELEKKTCKELMSCLRLSLKAVKYLVVMDDIWDNDAWDLVRQCLPDENNGSRIIMTTRDYGVTNPVEISSQPYRLRFLKEAEGLELLLKKAIARVDDRRKCPQKFKEVGIQMVRKCGGLPLALAVLGGSLSLKRLSTTEWDKVERSLIGRKSAEGKICMEILALSYANLPRRLQQCFLYLAAFPKGAKINVQKLMRLWIAEGFVENDGNLTLEECATEYFEQLVHKSLIEVAEWNSHLVEECSMHNVLHEWAVTKANELDFFHHLNRDGTIPSTALLRRMSIMTDTNKFMLLFPLTPGLRTLLGFDFNCLPMSLSLKELELIKVIDLEGAKISEVPKQIGHLSNLRYIGLKGTSIRSLPDSICRLHRLQTLDIRETEITRLNSRFWTIKTLRHLLLPMGMDLHDIHKGDLRNLQVLDVAMSPRWRYTGLHTLRNLKTLRLSNIKTDYHRDLYATLPWFSGLTTLELRGEIPPLHLMGLSNLENLKTLIISGRIHSLSGNFDYEWPSNLSTLKLVDARLDNDPLPSLGSLRLLRVLELKTAYEGDKMACTGGTFPELQTLIIFNLHNLSQWRIEDGAMPSLKKLEMCMCMKLYILPQGLKALGRLEELSLEQMSSVLCSRINEENGEDWENVRHIRSIKIR